MINSHIIRINSSDVSSRYVRSKKYSRFGNHDVDDFKYMTIDRSLHDFNLLMKGATKTTKSGAKEQKRGFLGVLCTFCVT